MLNNIINKLAHKVYSTIKPFIERDFHNKDYFKNDKIHIGKNVYIDFNAVIRLHGKGTIIIDDNTSINHGVCLMTYGGNIKIGKNCDINPYTIIYGHGNTTIGNNVLIAGHCMIIPNNHNISDINLPISKQGNTSKGILIEDDVWIAHGCSILDGVNIGTGSVIGAGSVVNKSIPPYSIAVGIPAKIIKSRKNG
jgi:acetyltransferase-like isoleucine patch superfamily enzyme